MNLQPWNLLQWSRASLAGLLVATAVHSPAHAQDRLSLHDAIAAAQTSPNAQIADEQVNVARGQLLQAGLRLNPRIYFSSEDLQPWNSNTSFANNTEDYGYIGKMFEIGGKRERRVDEARANVSRSEAERTLRMQQIAGRVAASYWSAVATEQIAALLRTDLSAVDEMVRYHQERVDAGAMRGVDLIRIQIERDRIYLALEAAERDAALARVELVRQIGKPVGKPVVLTDDIFAAGGVPAADLQLALAQRADVTVAKDQLAIAEADVKLQRANGVPDLDLLGGYKRNSGADTIYTQLNIPLPVFNRNQGEVERAQAQVRVARATLEEVELTVRADVEAAQENYDREQKIVKETLPGMRARAKENLQIMTEAYRIGGVDLLRYLDAERTEIDIEVTALRTFAEFQQSVVRLQLAVGGRP